MRRPAGSRATDLPRSGAVAGHRSGSRWCRALAIAWLGAALVPNAAAQEPAPDPGWKYDPENAQYILDTCAGCHGKNGEGGKGGTYPRIAGLDEKYIAKQLRAFKARDRHNIPMQPYANERELPESDIRDIARLFSTLELPTEMPSPDAEMSALERLLAAQAVFNVPRVDGDVERGAALYEEECGDCHGPEGWGEDDAPQLAGQYTEYLRRQLVAFRSGTRVNDDMEDVFDGLEDADLEDIFAFLATLDD
jgi:cytochrome c553